MSLATNISSDIDGCYARTRRKFRELTLTSITKLTLSSFHALALLFIRTYALYDRSKRVLWVLGFAFLTGLVTTIWSVASSNTSVNISSIKSSALQGCELPLTTRQADFLIAPWCSMLLFDAIVFLLTLRRSVQVIQLSGASGRMFQIMLRDGTIYFGALVILNTLNILTFLLVNPSGRGMASTLTNVMASILVSRLMLNLRDPSIGQYPHLGEVNIETTEQIISTNIFTMDLSEGGYSRESELPRNV